MTRGVHFLQFLQMVLGSAIVGLCLDFKARSKRISDRLQYYFTYFAVLKDLNPEEGPGMTKAGSFLQVLQLLGLVLILEPIHKQIQTAFPVLFYLLAVIQI